MSSKALNKKAKEFVNLKYKIHDLPAGACMTNEFPELRYYPEFLEPIPLHHDKTLKYIFYCYDLNSDLVSIADLMQRKEVALTLAGFEKNKKGEWPDDVKKMITFQIKEINDMIFCFLKIQNNRVWTTIVTSEQAFDEYQNLILQPVTGKDDKDTLSAANTKSKLMEESDLLIDRIDKYYKKLFGDNVDLVEVATTKVLPISPQTINKHFS